MVGDDRRYGMFVCVDDDDNVGSISSFAWEVGGGHERIPRVLGSCDTMFIEVRLLLLDGGGSSGDAGAGGGNGGRVAANRGDDAGGGPMRLTPCLVSSPLCRRAGWPRCG